MGLVLIFLVAKLGIIMICLIMNILILGDACEAWCLQLSNNSEKHVCMYIYIYTERTKYVNNWWNLGDTDVNGIILSDFLYV